MSKSLAYIISVFTVKQSLIPNVKKQKNDVNAKQCKAFLASTGEHLVHGLKQWNPLCPHSKQVVNYHIERDQHVLHCAAFRAFVATKQIQNLKKRI